MQIKVCPKCGKENQSTNVSCFNCYASLDNVVPTESTKTEEVPVVQAEPKPRPAPPSPAASGPVPLTGQAESPQGPSTMEMAPPIPPYGPPPVQRGYEGRPSPGNGKARSGPGLAILIAILVIGALGFGGWQLYTKYAKPLTPAEVVQLISDPIAGSNWNKIKPYMSQATIQQFVAKYGGEEAVAKHIGDSGLQAGLSKLTGSSIQVGTTTYEGPSIAFVEVKLPSQENTQMKAVMGNDFKFELGLIREDDKWKFDIPQTKARLQAQVMKILTAKFGKGFSGMRGRGMGMPGMGGPSGTPSAPMMAPGAAPPPGAGAPPGPMPPTPR